MRPDRTGSPSSALRRGRRPRSGRAASAARRPRRRPAHAEIGVAREDLRLELRLPVAAHRAVGHRPGRRRRRRAPGSACGTAGGPAPAGSRPSGSSEKETPRFCQRMPVAAGRSPSRIPSRSTGCRRRRGRDASIAPIQTVSPSPGRQRERARRGACRSPPPRGRTRPASRKRRGSSVSRPKSVTTRSRMREGALRRLDQPVMMRDALARRSMPSRSKMPRIIRAASPCVGGGKL